MSRFKAASLHLIITLAIAIIAISLIVFVWYPPPLFGLMGALGLLYLVCGCDIVIGPLLTLLIFKSGKKGMKFDLMVIALLQISALVYGAYVVAVARPVYLVFVKDRFEAVTLADFGKAERAEALAGAHPPSWTGPEIIAAPIPTDRAEAQKIFMLAFEGKDIHLLPHYYTDYDKQRAEAWRVAKPLRILRQLNSGMSAPLDKALAELHIAEDNAGFLPVNNRGEAVTALVERGTGKVLKLVGLKPWT